MTSQRHRYPRMVLVAISPDIKRSATSPERRCPPVGATRGSPGQLPRLERRSMTRCSEAWNADLFRVPSR